MGGGGVRKYSQKFYTLTKEFLAREILFFLQYVKTVQDSSSLKRVNNIE